MSSVHNKVSYREVQLVKTENICCKYSGNLIEIPAKAIIVLKDMPEYPIVSRKKQQRDVRRSDWGNTR